MTESVVSDTGPIIHLDEAGALDLLSIFESLHVPRAVYDELETGGIPDGFDELAVSIHDVGTDAYPTLDPGESAALVLCSSLDATFLTDDLDARETADAEGVDVHGSIGVVCYALGETELTRDEASTLLRTLDSETSLYLSEPLLEYAIRLVERGEHDW